MHAAPPRSAYDLSWNMLGMPIRIHPLFWLMALLLGWRGAEGDLSLLLVWVVCVLISILVHELGHALIARLFGAEDVQIVLYSMGGLAIHAAGLPRWKRIVELLMGPGAQLLVFAGPLMLLHALQVDATWPLKLQIAILFLIQINLVWAIVNLLPIWPLDGGQVVHALANGDRDRRRATIVHQVSIAACAVLGCLAVGSMFLPALWFMGGLWTALVCGVLAFENWRVLQVVRQPAWMAEEAPREPWERDPDWWKG